MESNKIKRGRPHKGSRTPQDATVKRSIVIASDDFEEVKTLANISGLPENEIYRRAVAEFVRKNRTHLLTA